MNWLWYILSGLCAGVAAGMGMGGGTLLIPVLTLALGLPQHAAQGVNVLACLPIIFAGALGALAASFLAGRIDAPWLRRMFGGFLILLACLRAFGKRLKK